MDEIDRLGNAIYERRGDDGYVSRDDLFGETQMTA